MEFLGIYTYCSCIFYWKLLHNSRGEVCECTVNVTDSWQRRRLVLTVLWLPYRRWIGKLSFYFFLSLSFTLLLLDWIFLYLHLHKPNNLTWLTFWSDIWPEASVISTKHSKLRRLSAKPLTITDRHFACTAHNSHISEYYSSLLSNDHAYDYFIITIHLHWAPIIHDIISMKPD